MIPNNLLHPGEPLEIDHELEIYVDDTTDYICSDCREHCSGEGVKTADGDVEDMCSDCCGAELLGGN